MLWLWRDRWGQLAILTLVTGLIWLTGWATPYVMLLALTRRRLGLLDYGGPGRGDRSTGRALDQDGALTHEYRTHHRAVVGPRAVHPHHR